MLHHLCETSREYHEMVSPQKNRNVLQIAPRLTVHVGFSWLKMLLNNPIIELHPLGEMKTLLNPLVLAKQGVILAEHELSWCRHFLA